jgi:gluconokinase
VTAAGPVEPVSTAQPVAPGGRQPVLVVMGVSGSGKSTIAAALDRRLHWEFAEGDDMHPEANVHKMSEGIPLTDEDRWPWLRRVAAWITERTDAGRPGIVTCSALKRSYRDLLRGPHVVFVYLDGSPAKIHQRMAARTDHYMPVSLLTSQLQTMEPPAADENVLVVGIGGTPDEIATDIIDRLALRAVPSA